MAIISVSEASDQEEEGWNRVLIPTIDLPEMAFDDPPIDNAVKALAQDITHPGITSIEPEPMVEPSVDPQPNTFSDFVQQAPEHNAILQQQDFINTVMGYPPVSARLEPMMEPSVDPQLHLFDEYARVQQAQQMYINAWAALGHFPPPGYYQIPSTCQMMDTRLNPMVQTPSVGLNAQGEAEVGHHLHESLQPPMVRARYVPPHQRERRLVDGPPARSLGSPERNGSQRRQRGRSGGKRASARHPANLGPAIINPDDARRPAVVHPVPRKSVPAGQHRHFSLASAERRGCGVAVNPTEAIIYPVGMGHKD